MRTRLLVLAALVVLAALAVVVDRQSTKEPFASPTTVVAAAAPSSTSSSSTTAVTTTTTRPSTTTTVGRPPGVDGPTTTPDDREKVRATAAMFIGAWMTPGTVEERTARLARVTSPGLLPFMADIPAENLPTGDLAVVEVLDLTPGLATVQFKLGAGVWFLRLGRSDLGWQVTFLDRPAGPVT